MDRVHAPAYRQFIDEACAQLDADEQLAPAGVSADSAVLGSDSLAVRASYFAFGTDAPLMRQTYRAARSAVDVAVTGAALVTSGARHALALCRPPGHHAEHDRMGGFCYFNNAVIAAHELLSAGRVAILDVDYHHGNGSQHLTYDRRDILYVSLHADPRWAYPGFSGTAVERGSGEGEGFNLNYPLWPGTAIDDYAATLAGACERIAAFAPANGSSSRWGSTPTPTTPSRRLRCAARTSRASGPRLPPSTFPRFTCSRAATPSPASVSAPCPTSARSPEGRHAAERA